MTTQPTPSPRAASRPERPQGRLARLTAPLRRLRWKMAFSYMAVTVSALLVLELLFIGGTLATVSSVMHSPLLARGMETSYVQGLIGALRPYLKATPPDLANVRATLDWYAAGGMYGRDTGSMPLGGAVAVTDETMALFVADPAGTIVAAQGGGLEAALMQPADRLTPPALQALTEAALAGEPLARRYDFQDQRLLLVTPILDEEGAALLGALGIVVALPTIDSTVLGDLLPLVGVSLVLFTAGAGVIGALFGFVTSRPLVRRLDRLAAVAGDWSTGDFTTFVHDDAGDELGALSRRMNRMAEQLQYLLEERNRLAVLEERNRIARELHDSAKQQAFAAAGQIGAAKALLVREPDAAAQCLNEAEELIYGLRRELTLLINELRPVALEDRGLASALREYARAWSRRTGIAAAVEIADDPVLPLETEQALYRIAQEALANAARHSGAAEARVRLTAAAGRLELTIADNGTGFDPARTTAGFGLSSMRQRAAALPEGTFELESTPGRGTTVRVGAAYVGPGASPPAPIQGATP